MNNQLSSKIKVGVVFGGRSGEHEVSIVSAKNVIEAIDKDKYEVIPIGITQDGRWLTTKVMSLDGESSLYVIDKFQKREYEELTEVSLNSKSGSNELLHLENGKYEVKKVDIFFPVLHGPFGEDGTIQGLFEMANVPYAGCGVLGSAAGMDKVIAKSIWENAGISVVPYVMVTRKEWAENKKEMKDKMKDEIGLPLFVKPVNMGSSVGITKVNIWEELEDAMRVGLDFDVKVLVEKGLNVRELECAILGNNDPKVSRIGEVLVGGEFYDYQDKYIDGVSSTKVPADISPELEKELQENAIEAYKLLDCYGFARVDAFLDKDTNKMFLNEINTIPGFTPISMYPKMWDATGVSYPDLIDKILQFGFEKYKEKNSKKISFEKAGDWFER